MPKYLIDLVHEIRVLINPRVADEFYDTGIIITGPLKKIEDTLQSWGAELNHPNQFKYPNQVCSGHLYLSNGRQLHIRVKYLTGAKYELKGHVEWHGVSHPFLHMMYAGLDYELGKNILEDLLKAGKDKIDEIKKKHMIL